MPLILRVDNLWKSYTAGVRGCSIRAWVLRGCSLHVALGERIAIVGPAASGKSTLLRCIAGDHRHDAGRVDLIVPIAAHRGSSVQTVRAPYLHLGDDDPGILDELRFGATAIVSCRDVARVRGRVDRIMQLKDGRLTALTHVAVRRVAEPKPPMISAAPSGTRGSSGPGTAPA